MLSTPHKSWYHTNRYNASSACDHCAGVIRHESWCLTQNKEVCEAYEVMLDPSKLSLKDQLILHALGVTWEARCKVS